MHTMNLKCSISEANLATKLEASMANHVLWGLQRKCMHLELELKISNIYGDETT